MDDARTKTIQQFSYRHFILEIKDRLAFFIIFIIIVPIIQYIILPTFRGWLIAASIVIGGSLIGGVIATYHRKLCHITQIEFNEEEKTYEAKTNGGKTIEIPLNNMGRVQDNEKIKMWSYAYIFEKDSKEKLRGTLFPYDVDKWIQRIKMRYQEGPDHPRIQKRRP